MYEDDYQFLYEYPINYSNINRRLRKIICNNEVCHAITESGIVFSWGNDIFHKGTLGLGENIYQVNTPVMNKYLSKNLIFDISLSEEHCAAIDFNNCLYTWGCGINGELGFFEQKEKRICEPNRVMINNKPFLVEKIKCGNHYTTGITNDGIPFMFGNNNNIIFFSLEKNFEYCNIIAKEVYCGDNFIIILYEKEKLLVYSFNDGLFEIILNVGSNNNNKNIIISKINILDKNIYIIDEKNKKLYEYLYQTKNYSKPFNIRNFYLNEYEINNDIKLSIIEMPFFVKFLFFWIECSENQKKNFSLQKNTIFQKISNNDIYCFKQYKGKKGPYINTNILFGNNKNSIELKNVEFENCYKNKNVNIFSKGNTIKYKNNKALDLNEDYLNNLPISKNYGNKNDVKDKKNINLDFDNEDTINLKNKNNTINNNENDFNFYKIKYNRRNSRKIDLSIENRRKYSISIDKNRTRRTISEYNDDDINETHENKFSNTININKKDNNSFLITDNYNKYNHNSIRRNKQNSFCKIKNNNIINSKTINHEDENEFDNILRNINKRQLMSKHPLKIEDQVTNTKKILSKLGRAKSKTELLIKELHETFFGKENKKQNVFNNYNNSIILEESKDNNEKKIFKFNRNINKTEIKILENKTINNNNIEEGIKIEKDYHQKKEIEIDINKILGNKNNNIKTIKKNEVINSYENENYNSGKEKLYIKLEKEKIEKEIKEIIPKKQNLNIMKEKLKKEFIEIEKNNQNKLNENKEESKIVLEKKLREKLENEYKQRYEKEKKDNLEQRKNLVVTTEVNKYIEGNHRNNTNNNKFTPERLKTENENEFIVKGIDKKNYNFIISNNEQINIENHPNTNKHKVNSNNEEFNLNIEDIASTRDILFENNNIINNNISQKMDNLLSPIPPQILNESKNDTNNEIINQQSLTSLDILQTNNINQNKSKEKKNENPLKFDIEDNNIKSDLNNISNINKDKGDNFELINLSSKGKENERNDISEKVSELDNSNSKKKLLNINRKEKSKIKNRINEIIEEKQELESLEDTTKSKNKTKLVYLQNNNSNNQTEKSLIPMAEVSTSNMHHISVYDQNIVSSIRKFEPKELDDITGSLRFFSNRSDNIMISNLVNKNNNKPASQRANENNNLNINSNNNSNLKPYIGIGEQNKNYFDLNKSNNLNTTNENIKDQKMKIDDLEQSKNKLFKSSKIIKLKNKEELNNILNEIQKGKSLNDSLYFLLEENIGKENIEINKEKDLQILKIKNNKLTDINHGKDLVLNNNDNDNNNNISTKFYNKLKFIRNYNRESIPKNHTNVSISNNKIREIQIKKMNRNKSCNSKQFNKKKRKEKMGIIEQIKKEQYEKRQQIIYNAFNNKNKIILTNNNITPYINLKSKKNSKNSVAYIGYNNMLHYDQGMIPININMNMNIMHDENKKKVNESFIILRKKYLDFLIKTYGNENIPKQNEKIDNIFLEGLINNEVPIENINFNKLKCSNDMKNFIGESLENFKLQQIKEKMTKINDSNFLYLNTNNNEKIQLDLEDDIKDKSNILEPIELDKSTNYNLNFRKSFVESLSGIKN